ncbi:MAG TPA: hypothetical protein VM581_03560 [Magnetospirillaceae bacterium]|nr:hypothetical protein [Magnetospirillaceae bacterium]
MYLNELAGAVLVVTRFQPPPSLFISLISTCAPLAAVDSQLVGVVDVGDVPLVAGCALSVGFGDVHAVLPAIKASANKHTRITRLVLIVP